MMKLSKQLKSDFNKCEVIIKENSKTFYKAFSQHICSGARILRADRTVFRAK